MSIDKIVQIINKTEIDKTRIHFKFNSSLYFHDI